jgi:hypothetical protein
MLIAACRISRPWGCALVALPLLIGCAGPLTKRFDLPDRYTTARQPLVIHSDVAMPEQQRLFEDLIAERTDIAAQLALPAASEPVHVYLFESRERFARYIREHHPQFPNRRAFFVESDDRLAIYAQWGERTADDLRHEAAHAYLHAVTPSVPLWLDEGLAKCYEPPRQQQGLNRSLLEQLAQRNAQGRWQPDLKRLERLDPTADLGQDDYAESWAWVYWLLQSRPENVQLLRQYLADLRVGGAVEPLSARLERTWGRPEAILHEYFCTLTATAHR